VLANSSCAARYTSSRGWDRCGLSAPAMRMLRVLSADCPLTDKHAGFRGARAHISALYVPISSRTRRVTSAGAGPSSHVAKSWSRVSCHCLRSCNSFNAAINGGGGREHPVQQHQLGICAPSRRRNSTAIQPACECATGITRASLSFKHLGHGRHNFVEAKVRRRHRRCTVLCAEAGISNAVIQNQAAYVAGWPKKLRNDRRLVILAAAQAQHAADYILGKNAAA
jgi:hypothetical protein